MASNEKKFRVLVTDTVWSSTLPEREVLDRIGAEIVEAPDPSEATLTEENGYKVEREGVRYDGQAFLFIDDPDGNNVEFCTASGYAPAPPRP
ncbi:MAG TPA: hypothetical protein EYO17_14075 [Dehalococcoidia bacterium]|nr:hypothetical protein [Dehalococcoidia bacterium]